MSPDTTAPLVSASPTLLQRLRWPLMVLGPILVIAAGVYFYVTGGRYESTDDAYTQAATVSISATRRKSSARSSRAAAATPSV